MPPKPPTLMIAVGFGRHGEGQDEDNLNREQDGDGDDDIATEAIVQIVRNLHEGGPSAVRDLRRFTSALEDICSAFMERDHQGVEEAASEARDVLNDMLSG
jgi:streptomycin 6-kinase